MPSVELAIVGAGPAGVRAAITAAEAGASVAVIDEGARPGGQFFRQPLAPPNDNTAAALRQHHARGRELVAALAHPKITLYPSTTVWDINARRQLRLTGPDGPLTLNASRVILATGATERTAAFPGWTLPGVMTAGAVQTLLKSQGLVPQGRVVVAGTGPLLLALARQLVEAGAQVTAVLEATGLRRWLRYATRFRRYHDRMWEGMGHYMRLGQARTGLHFGRAITRALGDGRVSAVEVSTVDDDWRPVAGSARRLPADIVCISFGFVPATELARLAGCAHRFDAATGAWVTETNENLETSLSGIYSAGEVRGIGGAETALAEGHLAGLTAAISLGHRPARAEALVAEARARQAEQREFAALLAEFISLRPGLAALASDDTMVCRCEGVRAGELRAAARAGATTLNALKAWNRCGMGPCQGRTCAPIAAAIVAAEAGVSLEAVGGLTPRPPIKPVPLSVVGAIEGPRPTGSAMEDHVGYGRAVVR